MDIHYSISCFLTIILLIWFETEAIVEYSRKLRVNFFLTTEYLEKQKQDLTLTYLDYLSKYHNCFFIRLITCRVCFCTVVSLLLSIFVDITQFPPIFVIGMLQYLIIRRLL